MMEKKIKTIFLCLTALAGSLTSWPEELIGNSSAGNRLLTANINSPKLLVGGSIVVINDDDLMVFCNEISASISGIEVYDDASNLVYWSTGCNSPSCTYTSNLSRGQYTVKVYTSLGNWSKSVSID